MTLRTIKNTSYAHEFQMGPMRVKQPLPTHGLKNIGPFILLHHAGPKPHVPGAEKPRLSPHPHRGFEPVTFVFSGKIHHKDSLGNEGFLQSGDVQWMTAGSGIVHSEGPSDEFAREGGVMEIIQLWINLPKAHKMTTPKYQDIPSAKIPVVTENGFIFNVVAGELKGAKGPAETFTPINAATVMFEEGKTTTIDLPVTHYVAIYVLEGSIEVNHKLIEARNMAEFHQDGNSIQISTQSTGKLLFLSGEWTDEPMIQYGPFVMNTQEEIMQAIDDYEAGKMGVLDF